MASAASISIDSPDVVLGKYVREIRTRQRQAQRKSRLRLLGLEATKIVSIVAGAGVTLVHAFDSPIDDEIASLLGFLIVAAQGVGRMISRGGQFGVAADTLARKLAQEQRLFATSAGIYADPAVRQQAFVENVEGAIRQYDEESGSTIASVLGDAPE